MDRVIVMFPVVVKLKPEDTIEAVMDRGADILANASIRPYIEGLNGNRIDNEEHLKREMENAFIFKGEK